MLQWEIERERKLQEQIARGELCKKETSNDRRYKATYEVYNAPEEWTKDDVIIYCDPGAFPPSYARKGSSGVWYVTVYID